MSIENDERGAADFFEGLAAGLAQRADADELDAGTCFGISQAYLRAGLTPPDQLRSAPEAFIDKGPYSYPSDVWSTGVNILCMHCCALPFGEMKVRWEDMSHFMIYWNRLLITLQLSLIRNNCFRTLSIFRRCCRT